jgi:V8-like Glu-specific endopeptidase
VGGAPSHAEPAGGDGTSRARPRDPIVDLPLAAAVADPTAPAVRMHGRVFFTIPSGVDRGDYSCSGTAVDSANGRVVWTAGHCAYELSGGGYVKNWAFVPAYQDGAAPFGEWPAKRLLVTGRYHRAADLRYDFAAANVARNASGQSVEDVVGARGIAFSQPRAQRFTAYGYPIEGRFEGNRREYSCTSDEQGGDRFFPAEPRPMAIGCDMTGGASGGGWINSAGVLLSVTSYGYGDDPFTLYGPYLGHAAEMVYDEAARKRKPKRGGHKGGKKHGHKGHKGGKRHRGHRGK